ncbi:hypothetical protein FACS189476_01150 [Spirochaetia bacterium]|nr:hypothetical protein FACS189476_01150 [Spirochaetia bacterium]
MSDIKIFVSHRIDLDSEVIDNPLFYPVRCGAFFDKRENKPSIPGDDTGDNISEKRLSYNELTVQYWVWKNVDADYYGLCHYRRYLSFSDKKFEVDVYNHVLEEYLTVDCVKKYGLDDVDYCRSLIEGYEIVVPTCVDITKVPTPKGLKNSVFEHWRGWDDYLLDVKYIDEMVSAIGELYPEYSDTVQSYLYGIRFRGHNCFIIRKELFQELCEFQFDVLGRIEPKVDATYFSETKSRIFGYIGELLFDIFVFHKEKQAGAAIKELPLVFFNNTEKEVELIPAYSDNNVPICLVSSNEYAPYVGVFITSILDNAGENDNYDFIILHKEIDEKNQNRLKRICQKYSVNASIRFYNMHKKVAWINFYISNPAYSKEAYYRLLLPWILKNYKKVLVFDSDIIAKGDVAELFKEDISHFLIAGVIDIVYLGIMNTSQYYKDIAEKEMKLHNPYNYINTGVLVLNLEGIRQEFTDSDVINFATTHKFSTQEQDVINVLFEGKIKFINLRWNYYVTTYDWIDDLIKNAPKKMRLSYETCKSPILVHWANIFKPWKYPDVELGYEFWETARRTEFYETIISRMGVRFYYDDTGNEIRPHLSNIGNSFSSVNQSIAETNKRFDGIYLGRLVRQSVKVRLTKLVTVFFPIGTKRREKLKKMYYKLRGQRRMG